MPDRHRQRERTQDDRDGGQTADEAWVSSLGQSDAIVALEGETEGFPFGGGSQSSIATLGYQTVAEWMVPMDRQAELDEISVSMPSNGGVRVDFAGMTFGPYSGGGSITIPFDGAALPAGYRVVVRGRSSDGNAALIKAQLTGRLY